MKPTDLAPLKYWPLLLLLLLAPVACYDDNADPAAGQITTPVFGVDESGANYLGVDRCLACHETQTPEPVAKYLASRHAEPGTVAATADATCLGCHDPLGEGYLLAPRFADRELPATGMTAVGCENCHGAGPHHLAMIPAHPNTEPDFNTCGQCHTALPAGPTGHAGSLIDDILGKYLTSAHSLSAVTILDFPLCARCHNDEGFRRYGTQTAGMEWAESVIALSDAAPITDPSRIQCRTCHDGHNGQLRGQASPGFSRQFNLCTSCHQVFLTATLNPDSGDYGYLLNTGKIPQHGALDDSGRPIFDGRVIWDTHFPTADGRIVGYGINAAAANACTLCHDPHAAVNW